MEKKSNNYAIPVAIVFAGIIIAGAVMFSSNKNTYGSNGVAVGNNTNKQVKINRNISLENIRPISSKDHILGNPDAKVKIVEYSDFECPFCKRFNFTMKKIMDEYGKNGDVAWVYRYFPIKQLHPKNGFKEAVISECFTKQKGNAGFWEFANRFFELTPSNDRTNLDVVIPKIAGEMGIDISELDKCVSSGVYNNRIQDDIANAVASGGTGTPWSVLIAPNGKKFPINGAQSYQTVKSLIDMVLKQDK